MAMTWWLSASSASTAASALAVLPPTPASTSSKIRVSVPSFAPKATLMASMTRLISPPEAMRAKGRGCMEAPGLNSKTTLALPAALQLSRGSGSTVHTSAAVPISRRPSTSLTAAANRGAASMRAAS